MVISGSSRCPRSWRRALVCSFVLITSAAGAEPVSWIGAQAIAEGTLSTPLDGFWSEYPQYAAGNLPFFRGWFGIQDDKWRIEGEFDLFQQYAGWRASNLPIPDPSSMRTFPVEYHGLQKADFVYDFSPLVVAIGRNKVHWGATQDSLIIADQVPFLDRVALHLPMGNWALDDLVASPETRSGTSTQYDATTFQVAHRLSWRQDGLEIGFTEQAILDRNVYSSKTGQITQKGSYTLTDFLPFSSVHETDVKPFNSMMILDVSWTSGNWRFGAEYGLDDFDARIFGIPDDPIPNIPAVLLEARYTDAQWMAILSVGSTHYLWGNYDTPLGKSVYRIYLDNGVQEMPLTSPYGPGATWITYALHHEGRNISFDGKAEVWAVQKGVTLDWPYADDPPGPGFDFYARAHLYAGIWRGGVLYETGPQMLLANKSLTEQWCVRISTSWGSVGPATARRRRGGADRALRAMPPLPRSV